MGAADIVPGVSGGTIALIAGIYPAFINALRSISPTRLNLLFSAGFKTFWQSIHAPFLLSLFSGIAVGILSLARLIAYLLDEEPISIGSFFFGLVTASIFFIYKHIKGKNVWVWAAMGAGTAISYLLTVAAPVHSPSGYSFLVFSGFSAIIAMMLPGISGAFILLLIGSYESVIDALNQFRAGLMAMNWNAVVSAGSDLGAFAIGAVIGLASFSRLLSWLFKRHKNVTLALLTGFMIGSLNKLWPWKEAPAARLNAHGKAIHIVQRNVSPLHYTQGEPDIFFAVSLVITGVLLIFVLEKLSNNPDV